MLFVPNRGRFAVERNFPPPQATDVPEIPERIRDFFELMGAVPIGVLATDLEGRLTYANARILESIGYSWEETRGRPVSSFFVSPNTPESQEIMQEILDHGWHGEVVIHRKDGSSLPAYIETTLLRDKEGKPEIVLGIARDITEQRAFQDRLIAEEKLGTLGLIAHNVSHELRNHISAIKMSLYMIRKAWESGRENTDARMHFSIAEEELNRIEMFLRGLVNYTRPPQPRLQPESLLDAVEHGIADAKPALVSKSMTLFRQFPHGSPTVVLDSVQFSQAVTQVIQNACEAAERQGEIHVVVKRQPADDRTWWLVEIRDNGPGIAFHLQERVFEPFFSTTKQRLGLGLSNVRRILELHQGEALIESLPGRGTVVTLRIPERPREQA